MSHSHLPSDVFVSCEIVEFDVKLLDMGVKIVNYMICKGLIYVIDIIHLHVCFDNFLGDDL